MNRQFSKEDIQMANKHEKMLIITGHQRNENQKNKKIIDVGVDAANRKHFYTAGGNVNYYNHYGKQCGDSLQN